MYNVHFKVAIVTIVRSWRARLTSLFSGRDRQMTSCWLPTLLKLNCTTGTIALHCTPLHCHYCTDTIALALLHWHYCSTLHCHCALCNNCTAPKPNFTAHRTTCVSCFAARKIAILAACCWHIVDVQGTKPFSICPNKGSFIQRLRKLEQMFCQNPNKK